MILHSSPYKYTWNTASLHDSSAHLLVAKAFTQSGKTFSSSIVHVTAFHFAPSNLVANIVSDMLIAVSWTDNSAKEKRFELEYAVNGGPFTLAQALVANITSANVTGRFLAGDSIAFRVKAMRDSISSSYSNIASIKIDFPAPGNLSLDSLSDTQVRLSWQDNTDFETSFIVEHSTDGTHFLPIGTVASDLTSGVLSDTFQIDSMHYFRVKAVSKVNTSDYSNTVSSLLRFNAPSNLVLDTLSYSRAVLSWQDNTTFETGFALEHSSDGVNFSPIASYKKNVTSATVNDTFQIDSMHYFRVKALTAIHSSKPSNTVSGILRFNAPSGLSITNMSDGSLLLQWSDNSTFETGFAVERQIATGGWAELGRTKSNAVSWLDTGLDTSLTYLYRVRAFTGRTYTAYTQPLTVRYSFNDTPLGSIRPNPGGNGITKAFSFTPDGQAIACAVDQSILLYSIPDGNLVRNFGSFRSAATDVSVSPGGSVVLGMSSGDSSVVEWSLSSGASVMTSKEKTSALYSIDISPNGSYYAIAGLNAAVKLRMLATGDSLRSMTDATLSQCVRFSSSGAYLASGTTKPSVQIIRTSDGKVLRTISGFTAAVNRVAFNSTETLLATGSMDKLVKIWNVSDGTLVRSLALGSNYVYPVAFNPEGTFIAAGGYDPVVKIWRVTDGVVVRTLPGHGTITNDVKFSPDGKYFVTAGNDTQVLIYDARGAWRTQ
jgi:hypothetical protein